MLATWLALPVYAWQGLGVRRRTSRLLPAVGPASGAIEGDEPALSLLVLGDSSAASVGIAHSGNGLAAQLATLIAASTERAVRWRAAVVPHLLLRSRAAGRAAEGVVGKVRECRRGPAGIHPPRANELARE